MNNEAALSGSGPGAGETTGRHLVAVIALWLLRLVTVAALAVDAYVHADLAPGYDAVRKSLSQGELFRVESGAAALAALLLVLLGTRRTVWLFAFLVAAGGLGAVLLYRYVDVGAFGPLPSMYEPVWYTEKTVSAVFEGIGAFTALVGLLTAHFLATRRR